MVGGTESADDHVRNPKYRHAPLVGDDGLGG
jgi:hypothetical protein